MTQPFDDNPDLFDDEEPDNGRPSLLTMIILFLLVITMFAQLQPPRAFSPYPHIPVFARSITIARPLEPW